MTTIYARVQDQVLTATISPKLACNNRKSVKLHVDFDSKWDGYAKSALFFTDNDPTVYPELLSSSGECTIPHEVLADAGRLFITIQGINSSTGQLKSTTPISYKILPGTPSLVVSDPSPSVYEQLATRNSVIEARMNTFETGSTVEGSEVMGIRTGADGKTYDSAGEAVRTQFNAITEKIKTLRGFGFMAEGELLIDTNNKTICAKALMLLTSDRSFAYITNNSTPIAFDNTGTSLRSIFAVKTDGGYELHLGTESDMNKYENVYYICGYYSGKLVGGNFSPKLAVTINGNTKDAWVVTYNGNYNTFVQALNEQDNNLNASYQKLIDFVYHISSVNENVVEFTDVHITSQNVSVDASGELGNSENLSRLSVREMIPAYNSGKIEIVMSIATNYACNLYLFDENRAFISTSYHTGENGIISIPIDASYFRVMICRTSNESIDTNELVKIRLHSVKNKTTLDMIPEMLLSNETTHIKLLGDSITQGMGSTGYVGYTITENDEQISVRGNGPDYNSKGEDYVEGDYLGELGTRRWYESTSSTGWSNKLKSYFESKFDCVVKNYGMSGIASGNLSGLCEPLVSDEDDIVILMIGTNDRTSTTKANFKANVMNFVNFLRGRKKKVVLMGSTPVSVANEAEHDFHMEDVNTILQSIAYSCNVAFISVYDHFIDYCNTKGIEIDTLLKDGLHPNDAGYEVMFKIISRSLGVSVKRDGAAW